MSAPRYDVIFTGDLVDGVDRQGALQNLSALFKVPPEKLSSLFNGGPQRIKGGLDREAAQKYKAALHRAGLMVSLRPVAESAPKPVASPAKAAPGPTGSNDPAGLSLAPDGSPVLEDSERQKPVQVEIDTSAIRLVGPFSEPEERERPAPPAPDTSGLSLAETGADLGPASEPPPPAPDTSHLDLAAEDVPPVASPPAPPPPATDDLSLAPAGSPVLPEDYVAPAAPPPPDTSHLRLDESDDTTP